MRSLSLAKPSSAKSSGNVSLGFKYRGSWASEIPLSFSLSTSRIAVLVAWNFPPGFITSFLDPLFLWIWKCCSLNESFRLLWLFKLDTDFLFSGFPSTTFRLSSAPVQTNKVRWYRSKSSLIVRCTNWANFPKEHCFSDSGPHTFKNWVQPYLPPGIVRSSSPLDRKSTSPPSDLFEFFLLEPGVLRSPPKLPNTS